MSILEQMIAERRSSGDAHDDMLDALLRSGDDGAREKLSDEQIIDFIITLIYSGYETMSTTSMMAVKYLSDHPRALKDLKVCTHTLKTNQYCFCEQKTILISKKRSCASRV